MSTCTYWGAGFIKVLKCFQVDTASFPIKVYRALESNFLPSQHLSCFLATLCSSQASQSQTCKGWGSHRLSSAWPQELPTPSATTSTMGVPPPFLPLFGTKYVRVINASAAKNLRSHTGLRNLRVQLKGSEVWILQSWEQVPAVPFQYAAFLFRSSTKLWLVHLQNEYFTDLWECYEGQIK